MITLAGFPLLLPDGDAELVAWQQRFQDLCDTNVFADEPQAVRTCRNQSIAETRSGVGLPRPNFTNPPAPRLNTLYWPTGASRWARGYFLADGATKDKILAQTTSSGSSSISRITLSFGDDSASGNPLFAAGMYLLPPRPLSATTGDDSLWVLPLVDARYWWQSQDSGTLALTSSSTWANLYSALSSGLLGGGLNADAANSAYLHPDWIELQRTFENVAVMLDAVAASIGHRIVRGPDGSCGAQLKATADKTLNANQNLTATLQAGAEFSEESGDFPANVLVTFPKFSQGMGYCDGSVKTYTNGPGATAVVSGTEKVIHSGCYADFSSGSGTPANDTALSALAAQIATDFYAWQSQHYDYTYNGVVNWQPCGHDDFIEWRFGAQLANGTYQAHTRVCSMPHDFGVDQQCSQDSTLHIVDSVGLLGKFVAADNGAVDPWAKGTSAKVRVYGGTPGLETYQGFTLKAYNGWQPIKDGTFVWIEHNCDGWYLMNQGAGNALLAKWTGATIWNPGTNSSNAVEVFGGAAVETDQFYTVNALNRFHTIMPGDFFFIVQNADAWYVVAAFTDVLFGQLQSTNINQGSTGSVHVFDDAFNDTGLTVTVRALHDLVKYDYVQLFWERVNTNHDYEWYAIPLSRPCIGKATAAIVQQTAGSIEIYDSKRTDLGVARNGWAFYRTIAKNEWCLSWWDYKQQQFFAMPLNAVLFGKYDGSSTTRSNAVTDTVKLYDDKFTDLATTLGSIRPLTTWVKGDWLQLFWDSNQNEFYGMPLGRPLIGIPSSAAIALGGNGNVALYDTASPPNALSVIVTVYATVAQLPSLSYCQIFWDYTQQHFFGIPLPLGVAVDIDFTLTSALAHGDATASATINHYNPEDALGNGSAPAGTVTIKNTMGWSLPSGGHGWATLSSYNLVTGAATYEIRSVRMTDWSGYTAANVQVLGHDASGNTKWYDSGLC